MGICSLSFSIAKGVIIYISVFHRIPKPTLPSFSVCIARSCTVTMTLSSIRFSGSGNHMVLIPSLDSVFALGEPAR